MNATEKVLSVYDKEQLKEIANHGCESGVCSQHIYYADTIRFFDNYEEEITDYIITNFGTEFLSNIFTANDCCLDMYKNDVCWAFIESVAFTAVDEEDERIALEDAKIAEYMQPMPV